MRENENDIYVADFETTSLTNYQLDGCVRVYLWSLVSLDQTRIYHGTDIDSFLDKVLEIGAKKVWFHNLRFDGSFIVSYLEETGAQYGEHYEVIISGLNIWYEIKILTPDYDIRFWDSLKKFPGISVKALAKLYGIPDKLDKPDFNRYIPEGYIPSKHEIEYCVRDSVIVAYALQQEYAKGRRKMTLSSDAFYDVKKSLGGEKFWRSKFPLLSPQADNILRPSYKGGWTYLNPIFKDLDLDNVTVFDVNSLYPHVMRNCELPIGLPTKRDEPRKDELYIVNFKAMFTLKKGKLPTIQIKGNHLYNSREYLTTVDEPAPLSLTNIDYKLFKENYRIDYETDHEYWCFRAYTGLLKEYIDLKMDIKERATIEGNKSERKIAKLDMNSPYGKTGTKIDVVNKIPFWSVKENRVMFREEVVQREGIYLPYASFVCAQARNITIRSAQDNYKNFVYADTDSLHLLIDNPQLDIHPTKLGAWKNEGTNPHARYLRAKRYIHVDSDYNVILDDAGNPEGIKCAGMPDDVKKDITWDIFKSGAEFEGKIMQKQVKGGCVLLPTKFKLIE